MIQIGKVQLEIYTITSLAILISVISGHSVAGGSNPIFFGANDKLPYFHPVMTGIQGDLLRVIIPVVPHKAVAEVSRIGNYRRDWLL